ncbi:MAG TPA: replicative DNA helicase [Candidatus Angelobacter sp.]|jgi:replicative DNA helicase|nr:replicative DNA helicase [Candidatus Angelobacter sp.]
MATTDYSLDRGLPASAEAERAILGAILLDNQAYPQAAEFLQADDFSLDSHRRIYLRMMELAETGRPIDYVTLTEQLGQHKEIEAVGGVAYVTSLTDGLPRVKNIDQYVRIVRDKALLRGLIHAASNAIQKAYDQEAPAEEIVDAAEADIFKVAEKRIGQGFMGIPEIVKASFGSIDKLYEQGQRITGLETHFEELDAMTSGLQKSDLIIIAARPSMGKTAFAINIAENAAVRDNKVVGVFSLEMSRESLLLRLLCSQAMVDSHKLRTGFLSREDYNKLVTGLAALVESPIYIDDTPGISISEMRAKCRRLQQSQGRLDLIIVDYLQLCAAAPAGSGGKRYENRTQEVSAISRGLKALAKEMRCPVIALSQLSRAPESRTGNNRPQLADLRESGAIEQDADVVGFIFREEVYKQDDPDLEGKAELIIAKQRNGPTGTCRMAFIKRSTRFENLAAESGPPEY